MSENVNFHMTFPPTPAYIGRLLKIADGRVRTVAEIAEETGIPEGAASGKVRPHIQYASYMGLLNSSDFTRTPLGKIVYLEDCMLTEKLTQMLCHVNMISPTGAPMWRYLFHELFPENQGHISNGLISDSMKIKFGATAKFAPLITMYTKQFTELNLISLEGDYIIQNPSAFDKDLLYVYGYALFNEWEAIYPEKTEITAVDLEKLCFRHTFGWTQAEEYEVLEKLCLASVIGLNRQLVPFTVRKLTSKSEMLPKLYTLLF